MEYTVFFFFVDLLAFVLEFESLNMNSCMKCVLRYNLNLACEERERVERLEELTSEKK